MPDDYASAFDLAYGQLSGLPVAKRKDRAAAIARAIQRALQFSSLDDLRVVEAELTREMGSHSARSIVAPFAARVRLRPSPRTPRRSKISILTEKGSLQRAESLFDALVAAGHQPWLYSRSIQLGRRIRNEDEAAVADAEFIVLLVSLGALASNFVGYELDIVHLLEMDERRERLLPVLVDEIAYHDLPPMLRSIEAVRWTEEGPQSVVRSIEDRIQEEVSRGGQSSDKQNRSGAR